MQETLQIKAFGGINKIPDKISKNNDKVVNENKKLYVSSLTFMEPTKNRTAT